jgi:hypothetical protein
VYAQALNGLFMVKGAARAENASDRHTHTTEQPVSDR